MGLDPVARRAPQAPFTRLQDTTGIGPGQRGWQVGQYEGTGEVSLVFVDRTEREAPEDGPISDEEALRRALDNRSRALRRSRARIRRYVVRNRLVRMWTLTYAESVWDRARVMGDVNTFLRLVREHLGRAIPYVYVLELHPGGHGLHVHLLLPARFIRHAVMARMWGHGFVQFSDENRFLHRVQGGRARARAAASYLVKYVGKELGSTSGAGEHAYEVGEGFQPEMVRRAFVSFDVAMRCMGRLVGPDPVAVWSSDLDPTWHGPPAFWAMA